MEPEKKWRLLETSQVLDQLHTSRESGLSAAEVARRLAASGPNEIVEKGGRGLLKIILEQFSQILVLILIAAATVSFALGEYTDGTVILAILFLNATLGAAQEFRAERAIAALKRLAAPTVRVRRNGHVDEISAREVVPGDIILLEAGHAVPADARIISSANLQAQESALTGESTPVDKSSHAIPGDDDLPVGDRGNIVHMGTLITTGHAEAAVVATGMQTELGRIAHLIQEVERDPTPLQRRLARLGQKLALIAGGIIALVVILGIIRHGPSPENLRYLFLTGVSMAVAAVPEGLPAVVTIALALGSQRMLKRKALIRKLPAVESLGSVTVICSDKTGTLTENRMTVTMLDIANEPAIDFNSLLAPGHSPSENSSLGLMQQVMTLCNDAEVQRDPSNKQWQAIGDPTEDALAIAAAELGMLRHEIEKQWPRVDEIPFSSERKRMTTIHSVPEDEKSNDAPWNHASHVAFSKGAVANLLEVCTHAWINHGAVPLHNGENLRPRIEAADATLAAQGQRVLGLAFRPLETPPSRDTLPQAESHLIFIGLVSMHDPPRPEVAAAVAKCRSAGIRPLMITGDHPLTGLEIARRLDIARDSSPLTGPDLNKMSPRQFADSIHHTSVYARVSPEHKLRIVDALQEDGEIVAMTGDGVNDAPALKSADIGVAMGIIGTDVAKEAADVVLLDDDFATIVSAVEEGRVIFDNIRKFVKYTLSSNTGELLVMLAAPFFGMPLPLLPVQILWINLVTDGLPGLALAVEPGEPNIMQRRPFGIGESIFSRGLGRQILWVGALMGSVSLGLGFVYWLQDPNGPWQTMIFTTLTLSQMGNALATRSNVDSIFRIGFLSNRLALGAVLLTLALQLAIIYTPFLQPFFHAQALSWQDLAIAVLASTTIFWTIEAGKWLKRSRSHRNS